MNDLTKAELRVLRLSMRYVREPSQRKRVLIRMVVLRFGAEEQRMFEAIVRAVWIGGYLNEES